MAKGILIIADQGCMFFDGHELNILSNLDDLSDSNLSGFDVYLNTSDMDVALKSLPPMGFFDRVSYGRQRKKHQKSTLLMGASIYKDCLVEVTSPRTQNIQGWLDRLVSFSKPIQFIKPFLIPISGNRDDKCILVVSAFGSQGLRQTAYLNGKPVFTRLTDNQAQTDEIVATLTYLKNQFQFHQPLVQCHLSSTDCQKLQNTLGDNVQLDFYPLEHPHLIFKQRFSYAFTLPPIIQSANRNVLFKKMNRIAAVFVFISLGISGWQYYDFSQTRNRCAIAQNQTMDLNEKIKLAKVNLPLDKVLPPVYAAALSDSSPILLFHKIAQAMPTDLTLSALKWENNADSERLLLEVKLVNQDDEADQNVDVIHDFQVNLQDALPDFQMQTQSLPHASAQLETFSGTATQDALTLSGDRTKGMIEFNRNKKS